MFRPVGLTTVAALGILFSALPVPRAEAEEDGAAEAKRLFVFVETVSRLGEEEQKQHIQEMYQETYPALRSRRVFGLPFPGPSVPTERAKLSPEQLAENIIRQKNWSSAWLIRLAEKTCLDVLSKNQEHVTPLLTVDLRSKKESDRTRALHVIGALRLTRFFDSVVHILETDVDLSRRAAYTLRDIRDPRAIALMVQRCPDLNGKGTFGVLRSLQTMQKADPSLVMRLSSKDPEIRFRAAYALAESGDPALIPHVRSLARDKDARVREAAANIGLCIRGPRFGEVRPVLVSLLSDSSVNVRSFVARCFAQRGDPVCARTLLELLRDTSTEERKHSNIVQAVHSLTGSYFGYYHGSDAWRPTTENNRRAIKRFADWVDENCPPAPAPE